MKKTLKKNKKNITFVIHPTQWGDYDILGIGDINLLRKLARKEKYYHLIKESKFGGIPILILDTTDTIKDTREYIKKLNGL